MFNVAYPIRRRRGLGLVAIGVGIAIVVLAFATVGAFFLLSDPAHHGKVPGDARPAGFKQLARWDSCGASGEYCSEVIIFGQNGISFDDAVGPIQSRYSDKGWRIKSFEAGIFDDGGIVMSNPSETSCMMLSRFDALKYRGDLSAPSPAAMAMRVQPYSTVIHVSAGTCG